MIDKQEIKLCPHAIPRELFNCAICDSEANMKQRLAWMMENNIYVWPPNPPIREIKTMLKKLKCFLFGHNFKFLLVDKRAISNDDPFYSLQLVCCSRCLKLKVTRE